jgi:predicted ArsR family transcriptional regulator
LENSPIYKSASERLLYLVKTKGPQTSASLAAQLQITGEAVRQQVTRLAVEGLVVSDLERSGVGRPKKIWKLTPAGEAKFPDRHAFVTIQLIHSIREQLGEAALDRIIEARARETEQSYSAELATAKNLEEKVRRLAAIRAREGYMADWRKESDGSFLLLENHCPICVAATACQGFCRTELATFQKTLGGDSVEISRAEHILEGARRCAYKIRPKDAPGSTEPPETSPARKSPAPRTKKTNANYLRDVGREGRRPLSATGSGLLRPQVGTASPPKRNPIVTPRFATYKVA